MHRFAPERWTNCSVNQTKAAPIFSAPSGSDAIPELALRAEAFISAQGGQASEDLLVSHVFGSAGSTALWRPLLREVLGRHDRLKLRGDGAWLLADRLQQPGIGALGEFVVLDVETTGLQPSRQRIVEIAVARFSGGSWRTDGRAFVARGAACRRTSPSSPVSTMIC